MADPLESYGDIHIGEGDTIIDWRGLADDAPDDDEDRPASDDLIEMLGFDPDEDEDFDEADEEEEEEEEKDDKEQS